MFAKPNQEMILTLSAATFVIFFTNDEWSSVLNMIDGLMSNCLYLCLHSIVSWQKISYTFTHKLDCIFAQIMTACNPYLLQYINLAFISVKMYHKNVSIESLGLAWEKGK